MTTAARDEIVRVAKNNITEEGHYVAIYGKSPEFGFRCDGFVEYCYEQSLGDYGCVRTEYDILLLQESDVEGHVFSNSPYYQFNKLSSPTIYTPGFIANYSSSINTNIQFDFTERMSKNTISYITIYTNMPTPHYVNFHTTYVGSLSSEGPFYGYDCTSVILDPDETFEYGADVTVTVPTSVTDLAGNGLSNPYQLSFTIQDEPVNMPTSIIVNANSDDTSIDPYQTITISGTAIYNTGETVDGTAFINTGENIYTAAVITGTFSRDFTGPSSSRNVTVTVSDGSLSDSDSIYISVSGDGSTNSYHLDTYVVYDVQDEGNGYCSYWYKDVFTTSDYAVYGLFIISNADLSNDLNFMLRFYYPNGSQYGSDLEGPGAFDQDWEWGWWYWGFLINGNSMAFNPGKYKVKFYVDNDRKSTKYYVVGWDFTRHLICKSVDSGDPWMYHNQSNIFNPDDNRAVAWHEFENIGQDIFVKIYFFAPDGSLYLAGDEYQCVFDLPEHHWYDWYRYYQPMTIKDAAPEYMCGDWTVKFFIKNPSSGTWERKYTDVFRIEEYIIPSINSISASPTLPIETQSIIVSISASDNNHLKKLILHWNDGTEHTQTWDNINNGSTTKSHNIGSFSSGTLVEYWAEVWDESGNRAESENNTVIINQEIITVPNHPTGDAFLQVGENTSYTTGGSTSSLLHSIEYQFDWGDNTQSAWNGISQSKYWVSEGYYLVKAHARCQIHTDRISDWSNSLMVTVDSTDPTVEITTNGGNDFSTTSSQVIIEGTAGDTGIASGTSDVTINTGDTNEGTLFNWQFTVDLFSGDNLITINATDNAGNMGQDIIVVTYIPLAPEIRVSEEFHSYESVLIGSYDDWILTIYNDGNSDLLIDALYGLESTDFILIDSPSLPIIIDPNQSYDLSIRFAPSSEGTKYATLSITNNDYDEIPYPISITGTGYIVSTVAKPTFLPDGGTHNDPIEVTISCSTSAAMIHYTTNGVDPNESDLVVVSGGTVLVDHTLTLKAKAWKTDWNPSEVKSANYFIQIPDIRVSKNSHDFGPVAIGSYEDWILTIYNDGVSGLSITGLEGLGSTNFSIVNSPTVPFIIYPYEPQDFTIRFSPTTEGIENTILSIANNDPNENPTEIDLMGTGINPSVIYYVDDDNTTGPWNGTIEHPFQYIQDAIDVSSEGAEVIVFEGTYYENIQLDKNIMLTSIDPDDPNIVANTVMDGGGSGSVVTITETSDPNCVLTGFTITNGIAAAGGGIHGENSNLTIIKCVIINNSTADGVNETVSNNYTSSSGGGGGIYFAGSSRLELRECTVSGNTTGAGGQGESLSGGHSGHGGGICFAGEGSVSCVQCTIDNNHTGIGGSSYYIEHAGNSGSGGGIYCTESAVLILENCEIFDNSTGNGGFCSYGDGAGKSGDGGGVYCSSVIMTLCSVTGNVTGSGGSAWQIRLFA